MLRRWNETEPIRLYVYGLAGPVFGLLLVYGLVSAEEAAAWLALAGVVTVPGVELARRRAWSPASAGELLEADPAPPAPGRHRGR